MKKAKSFCPGHVTLLFSIRDEDPDPLKKGSLGIGFSTTHGIRTEITCDDSTQDEITIFINNKEEIAPVSREVALSFLKMVEEPKNIAINHALEVPQKAGFGASGAGALSTALAMNDILACGLSNTECGKIAHLAEVKCKTGLGDVIGQFHGGFEMRTKEGAPGIGNVKKLDLASNLRVVCASVGILETREILSSQKTRDKIIKCGHDILKVLQDISVLTLDEIFKQSKTFARLTGLLPTDLNDALILLEKNGFSNASMVMLGKSLCCFTNKKSVKTVKQIIEECFDHPIQVFETEIDKDGARLIR
ncbi:MAG: pantoate kinase [Candidatus Helarchaeota archaeon]